MAGQNTTTSGKVPTQVHNHPFLMKVADRYQRLAFTRKWTIKTFMFLAACSVLMQINLYLVDIIPNGPGHIAWAPVVSLLQAIYIALFISARVGKRGESVFLLKAYSLCTMCMLGQHILTRFPYHTERKENEKMPYFVALYVSRTYELDQELVLKTGQGVEAGIDGLYFLALLSATLLCKNYVDEKKMEKQDKQAAGGAKKQS